MTEEKRRRSPRINYIKRSEYWKGKMYQRGVEQAKLEAHRKKPLEESAREHLGKFLDNLEGSSGVDVAIYASLAYLSYDKIYDTVTHPAVHYDYQTQADKDAAIKASGLTDLQKQRDEAYRQILITQNALDQCVQSAIHASMDPIQACSNQKAESDAATQNYNYLQLKVAEAAKISSATVGKDTPEYTESIHRPEYALIGPIGLKLATSMGGTPPVAQIAGLAILAGLGIALTGIDLAGILAQTEKTLFPTSPQTIGPTASPPLWLPKL